MNHGSVRVRAKTLTLHPVVPFCFRGQASNTALENIPAQARGLVSGFLQQGYAVGYLFVSDLSAALAAAIPLLAKLIPCSLGPGGVGGRGKPLPCTQGTREARLAIPLLGWLRSFCLGCYIPCRPTGE